MNAYTTEFFATCPNNGSRIKYRLRIETQSVIPVERIVAFVSDLSAGLHEGFADLLLAAFGGLQTLTADHHGVTIETTRTA